MSATGLGGNQKNGYSVAASSRHRHCRNGAHGLHVNTPLLSRPGLDDRQRVL